MHAPPVGLLQMQHLLTAAAGRQSHKFLCPAEALTVDLTLISKNA
jgi:hypothetical protein